MRLALVLLFVGVASALPAEELYRLMNAVDTLAKETLEYYRWLLNRHDPYVLPDVSEYDLVDDNINLKIALSNVGISKATGFTVDKIYTNLPNLQASFGLTFPTGQLKGNYQVTGTADNKNVQGSGTFSVDVLQWSQTGDIQFVIVDHSTEIDNVNLDFQISGIKGDIQGLNIDGISQEQIQEFLSNGLLSYLNQNKAEINKKVGEHLTVVLNPLIKILTAEYFKMLVASTPDPMPAP